MHQDLVIFMEVVMLDYKISPINKNDAYIINKTLLKELKEKNLLKKIIIHVRKGIALKLTHKEKIVGFCLAKEFNRHFSLSFYYIYDEHRKKMVSFFFFAHCINKMKGKPIFVQKNKNHKLYKKYFEETEQEGILLFKGLREDAKWAESLKQLKK